MTTKERASMLPQGVKEVTLSTEWLEKHDTAHYTVTLKNDGTYHKTIFGAINECRTGKWSIDDGEFMFCPDELGMWMKSSKLLSMYNMWLRSFLSIVIES